MPVLPIKVSQLMSPLVQAERVLEQGIAATGLPTIPGPVAVSQQLVTTLETAIEQLPGPEQFAAAIKLPALPAPAAPAAAPAAPAAPRRILGRRI